MVQTAFRSSKLSCRPDQSKKRRAYHLPGEDVLFCSVEDREQVSDESRDESLDDAAETMSAHEETTDASNRSYRARRALAMGMLVGVYLVTAGCERTSPACSIETSRRHTRCAISRFARGYAGINPVTASDAVDRRGAWPLRRSLCHLSAPTTAAKHGDGPGTLSKGTRHEAAGHAESL